MRPPRPTTFFFAQLGPRLQVGDADVLVAPCPGWVRIGFLVLLVVGAGLGGVLGGLLAVASAMGSAALLRRDAPPGLPRLRCPPLVPLAAVVLHQPWPPPSASRPCSPADDGGRARPPSG